MELKVNIEIKKHLLYTPHKKNKLIGHSLSLTLRRKKELNNYVLLNKASKNSIKQQYLS